MTCVRGIALVGTRLRESRWPRGLLLLALLTLLVPAPLTAQGAARTGLVLTNVTVIDVSGREAPRSGTTVVVEGNRITAIGPDGQVRLPARARRINTGGRFLVPGLWDMHVHTAAITMLPGRDFDANAPYVFPLLIAHGVTGIRDMSGSLAILVQWRDSIARGAMLGPRMVVTGRKVGSNLPVVPGAPSPIRTADDVRRSVRMLRERGADFVKVDGLPESFYPVLYESARAEGLRVAGHIPPWIGLREAANWMWTAEHLQGVFLDASTRRKEVLERAQQARTFWGRQLLRLRFRLWNLDELAARDRQLTIDTWSDSAAAELAARMVRAGTWETPTLIGLRDIAGTAPLTPRDDQVPYHLPWHNSPRYDPSDVDLESVRQRLDLYYHAAVVLARAGVPLLAGSDTPGTRRVHGFSLIEELEQLVLAGLTPLEALQAATLNPTRALGFADSLGTIEVGHLADLVLVDRNPLDSIGNLRGVRAVVVNGRYLPREELDAMLAGVRALVRDARVASQAASAGGAAPASPLAR